MLTIYSDTHQRHHAAAELIDGKMLPPFEMPKRAFLVHDAIKNAQMGSVLEPDDFGLAPILRVHDAGYVHFLQTAWQHWVTEHGEYDALPLCWPVRSMRGDRIPDAIDGKLGYYSFDAGTPITAGTWDAITTAVNIALTGQRLIAKGEKTAFALCRPPGHHAAQAMFGGYCFLNNAAIAAQAFRDSGAERVAILDVDYHHGNGTQAIFYDRADVLFISIHGHPAQEYPYYLGYEDEPGEGEGLGFNHNYPLRWGSDWDVYGAALDSALQQIEAFQPDALVISLGVDTYEQDPISRFRLTRSDFLSLGGAIARLKQPTLFVLEGGYAVEDIGLNVVNVLQGFEDAS
ncbi:MAG: histone deacetylase family protein [Leptolyngbyaceae bacterium]|nr:histone deacetylase family protein [Leptolyngbyaceae bacterium]